jgi:sugar phosphate isomerase/epimerase
MVVRTSEPTNRRRRKDVKFGFSTLGCPGWTLEHAVAAAREYGYAGIELRLIDDQVLSPALLRANLDRVRRAFADSGVALHVLGSSAKLSAGAAERAASETELSELIPLAKSLGVPLIRVFGGKRPDGVSVEQGVANVAAGLNALASRAEDAGVTLALETHDDFARSTLVAQVLEQVPSPAVGALWDTHHPYRMGETIAQVWTLLAPRLKHVHVKDARKSPTGTADGWDLVLLGEGEVPVREVVRTLALRSYGGYVVVEWEKKWHPEIPEPEVALPQHIARLREYAG